MKEKMDNTNTLNKRELIAVKKANYVLSLKFNGYNKKQLIDKQKRIQELRNRLVHENIDRADTLHDLQSALGKFHGLVPATRNHKHIGDGLERHEYIEYFNIGDGNGK